MRIDGESRDKEGRFGKECAMQKPDGQKRKVVVVGAGDVGSTYCYALCQSGLAEEIVLIDLNKDSYNFV